MRLERSWLIPFLAALAVAGLTRALFPFDGLYGQDAFAYFRYARAISAHLRGGGALPELHWPIGYPATVALVLPLVGGGPAAGQIVSALACACAAAATSRLVHSLARCQGKLAGDEWPAIVAGVAVAASGGSLRSSQVVMADGLGLGASAVALLCAVRHAETRRGEWLVGCAAAWAWGTTARWMVGLLIVPLGAFLVLHWRQWERRDVHARVSRVWPWVAAAAVVGLTILTPALVIARSAPLSLGRHEWLVAWSLRSALGRDFHTPEGHATYRLPVALFYLVRLGWPDYFFPVLALLAVAGARVLLRDRRWASAALLVGWPATSLVFLSGIPYENPRFLLPTLPAVGALVGIGFGSLWRATSGRPRQALALTVGTAITVGLAFGAREHARLVERKNSDRDLVDWACARLPAHPTLLMAGPTEAFEYYGSMVTHALFSTTPAEVDALVTGGPPLFLLANVDELETQWVGLPPERTFDALRRSPGMTVLGTHSPYTLFRVGGPE